MVTLSPYGKRLGRPPVNDPVTARARLTEINRRRTLARRRVLDILATLHPEEFERLLAREVERIAAESGPLPGIDPHKS